MVHYVFTRERVFLFNLERSERKYRVYNDDEREVEGYHKRARAE